MTKFFVTTHPRETYIDGYLKKRQIDMTKDVIQLVELLRKECRRLMSIPEDDFTDQDARKLQTVNALLIRMEAKLPADYFTTEKSLERFWARPDVQELLKKDPA